jgi:hypothetical protein
MTAKKTFESMTVDELDAYSVELKTQINELRDTRREAKAVRDDKVLLQHLADRLRIDVTGISPEQAKALLELAKQTPPREGDVVVTPEPGHFDVSATTPEVEADDD